MSKKQPNIGDKNKIQMNSETWKSRVYLKIRHVYYENNNVV